MNTVNILEEKKFTLSQILHYKLLISLLLMSIQSLFSEKGHISYVYLFLIECWSQLQITACFDSCSRYLFICFIEMKIIFRKCNGPIITENITL